MMTEKEEHGRGLSGWDIVLISGGKQMCVATAIYDGDAVSCRMTVYDSGIGPRGCQ